MNESEALRKLIPPGTRRPNKPYYDGVIQILVTSTCNLSCAHCTQMSQVRRKPWFMTPEQFEQVCLSLRTYWGILGTFGGCPTISPHFEAYCEILRKYFPQERCGLWANNLMGKGAVCRKTFNPVVSNLNVHMDRNAYDEMRRDWPEARPFGLDTDSRHAPVFVSMKDVVPDEDKRWEYIASCDLNLHWSAGVSVFRGGLRGWFCEIAMAQAVLQQDDPEYPDTGMPLWVNGVEWWRLPMADFAGQVRKHCHECAVPLRGYGPLSQDPNATEKTSKTYERVYLPKRKDRGVETVTELVQLGMGRINRVTDYMGNSKR